ncbi:hypothetical protein Pint_21598 [Pistacia integerrima]|uniref:Uncharacterized protein n=1 Tax=Pistacia integerrima TaxID=434235 RepID=A0ACC0XBG7_9ROSI|nr:hypothetical protein Pint_21598 [Pistacia integerrima]
MDRAIAWTKRMHDFHQTFDAGANPCRHPGVEDKASPAPARRDIELAGDSVCRIVTPYASRCLMRVHPLFAWKLHQLLRKRLWRFFGASSGPMNALMDYTTSKELEKDNL